MNCELLLGRTEVTIKVAEAMEAKGAQLSAVLMGAS